MTTKQLFDNLHEEIDNIITDSGYGEIKIIISSEGRKINIETKTNVQHEFEFLG